MERTEVIAAVQALEQLDMITISTDDFNYEVERVTDTEYRVSRMVVSFCVKVEYFEKVEQVIDFIY